VLCAVHCAHRNHFRSHTKTGLLLFLLLLLVMARRWNGGEQKHFDIQRTKSRNFYITNNNTEAKVDILADKCVVYTEIKVVLIYGRFLGSLTLPQEMVDSHLEKINFISIQLTKEILCVLDYRTYMF
jgi:hypothetical protein